MAQLPNFFPHCVCGAGFFDIDVAFDPPHFYAQGVRLDTCPDCGQRLTESAIGEELERWLAERPAGHPERIFAGVGSRLRVIDTRLRDLFGEDVTVLDFVYGAEDAGRPAAVAGVTCLAPYAPAGMCLAEFLRGEFAVEYAHHQTFVVVPSNLLIRCRQCGGDFAPQPRAAFGTCASCTDAQQLRANVTRHIP